MNREQMIDWIQQTQTMMQQLAEIQKNLNQGRAIKEMLTARGEDEHALEMAKDLKKVEEAFGKTTQVLLRKCKRDTTTGCETLLTDVSNRLKLADEAFDTWRVLLASNELESSLTPDAEARAAREAQITEVKRRYDTALDAASQAVPTPGVVIL